MSAVHAAIVDRIVATEPPFVAYGKLVCLSRTCRYWRDTLSAHKAWDALYGRLPAFHEDDMVGLSRMQRLELLCCKGCQRCARTFNVKIYWPIPIRVCTVCFEAVTIPEDRLINKRVPPARYEYLRSVLPTRHWRRYMRADIEAVLGGGIDDYEKRTIAALKRGVKFELELSEAALACSRRYVTACTHDELVDLTRAVREELRSHNSRVAACGVLRCAPDDIALSGTLLRFVDTGDRDDESARARIAPMVPLITREMAASRLRLIAGRYHDIAIPDVPCDDAAATKYVTDAVKRRAAVYDANNALCRSSINQGVLPVLELDIAVDDAIPLDTFLLAVGLQRKTKAAEIRYIGAKNDALDDVRRLTSRLLAIGSRADVDVGPIERAETRADVIKAADACREQLRDGLHIDERTFDAAVADARRVDPAFTMQSLVPAMHARLVDMPSACIRSALYFVEETRAAIGLAARQTELRRYQARIVQATGRKHERLEKFAAYASPTAAQLLDVDGVARDLMPWASRRPAKKQTPP